MSAILPTAGSEVLRTLELRWEQAKAGTGVLGHCSLPPRSEESDRNIVALVFCECSEMYSLLLSATLSYILVYVAKLFVLFVVLLSVVRIVDLTISS